MSVKKHNLSCVECAFSYSNCNWCGQMSFSIKKSENDFKLNWRRHWHCTNKICVIYFCLKCVKLLPKNVRFLSFFLGGGEGGVAPCPPGLCAYANAFWYFCADIFMRCFHERFSPTSTPRNLVTFSLSMAILSIFKKGSGSLKNLFFLFWGRVK